MKWVSLPPDASHLLPMLGLSTFGATKRLIARVNDNEVHAVQTSHIMEILDNFTSVCTRNEIVESFGLRGMSLLIEEGMRIIRCLAPSEVAGRVLGAVRDEPLRFNIDISMTTARTRWTTTWKKRKKRKRMCEESKMK
jgi:hypothetical protein